MSRATGRNQTSERKAMAKKRAPKRQVWNKGLEVGKRDGFTPVSDLRSRKTLRFQPPQPLIPLQRPKAPRYPPHLSHAPPSSERTYSRYPCGSRNHRTPTSKPSHSDRAHAADCQSWEMNLTAARWTSIQEPLVVLHPPLMTSPPSESA